MSEAKRGQRKAWRHVTARPLFSCAVAALLLIAGCPSPATARRIYVASEFLDAVSVIDARTHHAVGRPIKVGADPSAIAITPDGRTTYVDNFSSNTVSVIDTHSNRAVATVPLGAPPPPTTIVPSLSAVAITPDGRTAYVAQGGSNKVSVIDTATNRVVGSPIVVGTNPSAIAITPDGRTAFVANFGSNTVSVVDTDDNQVVGSPIAIEGTPPPGPVHIGPSPSAIAITPDGRTAFVANRIAPTLSAIDIAGNRVVDSSIDVQTGQTAVAITPDGRTAYATNYAIGTVSVSAIEAGSFQTAGFQITGVTFPSAIAISADGRTAYVVDYVANTVSLFNTRRNKAIGNPIKVGARPAAIAIVPDQPPIASFRYRAARSETPATFDASTSHDPDGSIARYVWRFGDGAGARKSRPVVHHAYRSPGHYKVTLKVVDEEGCSSSRIFTGQTVSCNGSARVATEKRTVKVAR